jgi:YfiH family protein
LITLTCLGESSAVRHGFLTRKGGRSNGIYASLNCGPGSKDDLSLVMQNREIALERVGLPPASLVTAYQVHSAEARVVERLWSREEAPKIDAMATNKPGLSLGILSADCAPLLLADHQAGVIGAAHAGWRGALLGVIESVIEAMASLGARPARIAAGIGPAIGPESYEVGPEFPAPFLAQDAANALWFRPHGIEGRYCFDLVGFIESRLHSLGVARIERAGLDTCALEDDFFSHRRMVRRNEPDYGRQLSVIGLT